MVALLLLFFGGLVKYGDDFGLGVVFFVWEVKEAVSVVWTSLSRVFSTSSSVVLTIVDDRWGRSNDLRFT